MDETVATDRAATGSSGVRAHLAYWVLVDANRLVIAAGICVLFAAWFAAAVSVDLLAVGPDSSAPSAFGSGLTSGVVTMVTVALSINELILSRVFGSPNELRERFRGTRELREVVSRHADRATSPIDPAEFLALLGRTIRERADALEAELSTGTWTPPETVPRAVRDVGRYGNAIDRRLDEDTRIIEALRVVLGTGYARNLAAVRYVRAEYAESLSNAAADDLDALAELLEAIAITRQFLKTLALQQNFARLSRLVVYTGLVGLAAALSLTFLYRSNATTVPTPWLPIVVGAGIGIVVAPLATFVSYVLRAATIAGRTLSVGPFVPPPER